VRPAAILDTDGGRLDGDISYDRAVGPMQVLPGTWARFGTDGDRDGVLAYNRSIDYARRGWAAADRYATART